MASEIKANKISPATGTDFTLGDSGDTFTVPSGVTLTNSGTATGFGSPAYASNASATDDTVNVDASDNLQFNSGYGSTATAYGCRAWVNFDGSGTVSIFGSANVSSITDNGTGDYTINFTNSMPDINYSFQGSASHTAATSNGIHTVELRTGAARSTSKTTSSIRHDVVYAHPAAYRARFDYAEICISYFR
jgi:hypothetical protein